MTTTRRRHSAKFKARVALEALRGQKTVNQLATQYQVHPVQIANRRKSALEQLEAGFADGRTRKAREEIDRDALYQQIGRLKMELEWLKNKSGISNERLQDLGKTGSFRDLAFAVNASYWELAERAGTTSRWGGRENLALMRLFDREYTRTLF